MRNRLIDIDPPSPIPPEEQGQEGDQGQGQGGDQDEDQDNVQVEDQELHELPQVGGSPTEHGPLVAIMQQMGEGDAAMPIRVVEQLRRFSGDQGSPSFAFPEVGESPTSDQAPVQGYYQASVSGSSGGISSRPPSRPGSGGSRRRGDQASTSSQPQVPVQGSQQAFMSGGSGGSSSRPPSRPGSGGTRRRGDQASTSSQPQVPSRPPSRPGSGGSRRRGDQASTSSQPQEQRPSQAAESMECGDSDSQGETGGGVESSPQVGSLKRRHRRGKSAAPPEEEQEVMEAKEGDDSYQSENLGVMDTPKKRSKVKTLQESPSLATKSTSAQSESEVGEVLPLPGGSQSSSFSASEESD